MLGVGVWGILVEDGLMVVVGVMWFSVEVGVSLTGVETVALGTFEGVGVSVVDFAHAENKMIVIRSLKMLMRIG
jgi:hypothetical protein